ncbi:MAG: hypothetical protein OSA99_17005 [Acidimicrobiales bacterium]|nr:hypothetical protein [Acidimicrobiales bacterium]
MIRAARLRPIALVGALAIVTVGATSCTDDGGGDLEAFCDAVHDLADNDPFAHLAVASPEEMQTAFGQLRDGVATIASAAPDDIRGRADRYLDAVDDLIGQLRGAAFDPRDLDTLSYRTAASEYEAAAVSIENAAESACN